MGNINFILLAPACIFLLGLGNLNTTQLPDRPRVGEAILSEKKRHLSQNSILEEIHSASSALEAADLVYRLHAGHLRSLSLSRFASVQSTNVWVKALARRMNRDLELAEHHLLRIASAQYIDLPPQSAAIVSRDQRLKHLRSLSGINFDREFLRQVIFDEAEIFTDNRWSSIFTSN